MLTVDLTNATKYPDIDEFFGFTTVSLNYMYIASTVLDTIAILGNIIVLYTSLRYKAFNLCKTTVTLLENLAAADLLHVVVGFLPQDLIIFTKTWTFGKAICGINGYFTFVFATAGIYLLVTISVHRLTLLRNPFWLLGQDKWKLQFFMAGLWSLTLIPTIFAILSNSNVYYEPVVFSCVSSAYPKNEYILFILILILLGVPFILIVFCNIKILIITVQYKKKMSRERGVNYRSINALKTVTCVCWVFIMSWIPYAVRILAKAQSVQLPKWFFIFQQHVFRLNVVLNPMIYTSTNRSFKACVQEHVLGIFFKSQLKHNKKSRIYKI